MAKRSIKRTRRLIALLACIALAMGLLPATASAEGGQTTGMPLAASALGATRGTGEPCGANLTWTLDDSGTLTISGTGEMTNFSSPTAIPWYNDRESITAVVINDGVTSIGDSAFFFCTALKSVEIPGSVKSIGDGAFDTCYNLESVEIPGGVTSIGSRAFHACRKLKSVEIPGGVKSIGDDAFNDCFGLTRVTIPDGVESIGDFAFFGCTALESVEIPKSVESIGDEAFYGCDKLADVYFFGTEQQWRAAVGDNGVVPGSTTVHFVDGKCGDSAYWALDDSGTLTISGTGAMTNYNYCGPWGTSIEKVVIENGVTSIGYLAFGRCTKLEKATIPGSVKAIESHAFFHCSNLTGLTISEGVESIGEGAFLRCTSLASVVIPGSVKAIEERAFGECWDLTGVAIGTGEDRPCSVTKIGQEAFIRMGENASGQKAITVNAYESHVTEKGDGWNGGVGVVWLWALVSAAANSSARGTATVEGGVSTEDGMAFRKADGATATLKAVPESGYVFANWTERVGGKDEVVSTDSTYRFPVSADRTLTANFKPALTITAKDQEYVYTGKQQGEGDAAYDDSAAIAEKVTVEGKLAEGDEITSLVMTGMQTSAGVYGDEIKITGCEIGNNTDNYAITFKNGTLTIKPAEATVTTGSASKAYDGKPLTNSEAKITGLVPGETATATATGSQTEVGSSPNTCSIKWGTADPKNYTVTEKLGTLTVEAAPARKGTLTFDLAGGTLDGKTGTVTVEANVGDTVKLPGAPTKDGYAFKFWKGSEYAAGAEYKVEGDHAFTAEWVAVHTVAFDANGHGKAPDAQTVEHGKKAKRPANPTADGYTFGGWYTDKACKEAYDFSKPVTEDVTLYAKWTKKSSSGTSPKTGDPLAGAFAVALSLAAASALALAASRRRRRG